MSLKPIQLPSQAHPLEKGGGNSEDLLNLFAEPQPAESRSQFILRSTPGLAEYQVIGDGPVSVIQDLQGFLYCLSGTAAFRVEAGKQPINIGTLLPTNHATVAVGSLQVVYCTSPNAYVAGIADPLVQITGDTFPGASAVAYLDGYFVFAQPDSGTFFVSKLLQGGVFDPLDYASVEAMPDVIRTIVAHLGVLWIFGSYAIEIWFDAGAADFPFRRQQGGVIYTGTDSPATVQKVGRELIFLSREGIVYETQGLRVQRISTYALEQAIAFYGDNADAFACSYQQEGHWFYAITWPHPNGDLGATWVYDQTTKLWHRRSSYGDGIGMWRARSISQFGQSVVVGDSFSGRLSFIATQSNNDLVTLLPRTVVFPPITAQQNRLFMSRLQIEMDTGDSILSPGFMILDWSDDGGQSWSNPRQLSTGASGELKKRVFTTRLGSFRTRTYRLRMQGYATIYSADAEISGGDG